MFVLFLLIDSNYSSRYFVFHKSFLIFLVTTVSILIYFYYSILFIQITFQIITDALVVLLIFLNIYLRFIIPHIRGYFSSFCFLFPRIFNSTLRKDRRYLFRVNIAKIIFFLTNVPVLLKESIYLLYRYCLYVRTYCTGTGTGTVILLLQYVLYLVLYVCTIMFCSMC